MRRLEKQEDYILAYLAEHPELSIDDIEIVEEQATPRPHVMTYSWYCRPKKHCDDTGNLGELNS